ncbi:antiviral reverse transcriptase Drt3a [Methylomonas sp. BW4-1]|uniref:antiviral reverse transcriptase Drt3a n=1 Tax=Methylomonas sp. BW4-1 TaxID=3376685 RepID=UPI004040F468
MLDQSFSVENFRKIFDYENRKGSYLEGRYFPEIEEVTKQLKTCVGKIKKLKVELPNYEELKLALNSEKEILKDKKEKLLNIELEKICHIVSRNDFSFNLIKVDTPTGKPIYKIDEFDVYSYFIIKQIQYNIKKLYKVQQSNRYNIICQLRSLLNDGFPKYIIRADIKEFYESISRERLLNKINKDGLLSLSSRTFIKVILNQYGKLSGSPVGIPRGIGISAYMAELYMRDFDHAIKNHPELVYYARYVDDIIAIYAPKPNSNTEFFLETSKIK